MVLRRAVCVDERRYGLQVPVREIEHESSSEIKGQHTTRNHPFLIDPSSISGQPVPIDAVTWTCSTILRIFCADRVIRKAIDCCKVSRSGTGGRRGAAIVPAEVWEDVLRYVSA